MRILSSVLTLALGSATLLAQGVNTAIIKERARELTGQKQPPLPTPGQQPAANAAPAKSAASAAQQQAAARLTADIAIIKSRREATQDLKDRLANNLRLARLGATHVSDEAAAKLADLLATALVGKKISSQEQSQLAGGLVLLISGAAPSTAHAGAALESIRTLLATAGAPAEQLQGILKELQPMAAQAQKAAAPAAK